MDDVIKHVLCNNFGAIVILSVFQFIRSFIVHQLFSRKLNVLKYVLTQSYIHFRQPVQFT